MAITTREDLKKAFRTGEKPKESDFENIFDSYFHKRDKIDVTSTTNIYSIREVNTLIDNVVLDPQSAVPLRTELGNLPNVQPGWLPPEHTTPESGVPYASAEQWLRAILSIFGKPDEKVFSNSLLKTVSLHDEKVYTLEQRVNGLDSKIDTTTSNLSSNIQSLLSRVAALESELQGLSAAVSSLENYTK